MMTRKPLAWPRRALALAFLGLLSLGLTLGLTRSSADAAPPANQQQVRELLQVDGGAYPAVVARVNDRPIHGAALAHRIYIVQHSSTSGATQANAAHVALEQLISDEVLLQVAPSQGVVVTDADVRAFAQDQARLAAQAKDGSAREIVAIHAAHLGVAPEGYFSNPQVLEGYRQAMIVGQMRAKIVETMPAAQRNDPAAQQAALRAFMDRSGARVETLIAP